MSNYEENINYSAEKYLFHLFNYECQRLHPVTVICDSKSERKYKL